MHIALPTNFGPMKSTATPAPSVGARCYRGGHNEVSGLFIDGEQLNERYDGWSCSLLDQDTAHRLPGGTLVAEGGSAFTWLHAAAGDFSRTVQPLSTAWEG